MRRGSVRRGVPEWPVQKHLNAYGYACVLRCRLRLFYFPFRFGYIVFLVFIYVFVFHVLLRGGRTRQKYQSELVDTSENNSTKIK